MNKKLSGEVSSFINKLQKASLELDKIRDKFNKVLNRLQVELKKDKLNENSIRREFGKIYNIHGMNNEFTNTLIDLDAEINDLFSNEEE